MDRDLQHFLMRTSHGRQFVPRDPGSWLLLKTDGAGRASSLRLQEMQPGAGGETTVASEIVLADVSGDGLLPVRNHIRTAALVGGRGETLYAGISDKEGTRLYRCDDRPACRDAWSHIDNFDAIGANTVLGDLLIDPDQRLLLPLLLGDSDEVALAVEGEAWRTLRLPGGTAPFPPVGHLDDAGTVHLAWGDACDRLFYARLDAGAIESGHTPEPQSICTWGRHPSILPLPDGRTLIGFEPNFSHSINYALVDKSGIRAFGDDDQRLTESPDDARFSREIFHGPHLAEDTHGVPWFFFVSATRKLVFAARWLGEEWGPILNLASLRAQPVRRNYRALPIGRIAVQKNAAPGAGLALHLQAEEPASGESFHVVAPAPPRAEAGKKILFLDMAEIASAHGIEVVPQPAVKCGANPMLEPGDPAAFDSKRVFCGGTVVRDDDRFRCWYTAMGEPRAGVKWWHEFRMGYAESDDGIAWRRPDLGHCAATEGNELPDMAPIAAICRDLEDPDPDRRYKILSMLHALRARELALEGKLDPLDGHYHGHLYTSPDGIQWRRQPIRMACPGGRHVELMPQSLFCDPDDPDPNRRYKAYGWMSMTQGSRGVGGAFSPDAIHWTACADNPVIAPETRGHPYAPAGPWSHIHDGVVFRYGGVYLALHQYLHGPLAFDLELAMSRDGQHFQVLNCGHKVIDRGGAGAWDGGMIFPSVPVVTDDEIRIYYGGANRPEDSDAPPEITGEDRCRYSMGLATLRLDGFSCARIRVDREEAILETLPFEPAAADLVLNADAGPGRIQVAVVDDRSGNPLPGFGFDDCTPLATDDLRFPVRWGDRPFPGATGRPARLRVRLQKNTNSPRLFSIGFS